MEVQTSDAEPIESDSPVVIDEHKLPELIASASLTFQDWTSLISEVDAAFSDDIEKLGLVYDAFLLEFPLCYGYWRKYANHAIRLCTVDKVVELFERAVGGATYCVDLWVDYCSFGSLVFKDPADVRRLFQRGLSYVGKDYPCHALWDKYIEFELSQQHWSSLAHIYIQALKFPTRKLNHYYENFKKLVKIWEEARESHSNSASETPIEPVPDSEVPTCYKEADISCIIKDLLDPSIGLAGLKALQKYIHIGAQLYQEASQLNEKISCFETRIRRPYFHVLPLDVSQLENWHHYLDFAELHGDFDWTVKLYERCLIPCANYPEFWMRYVEFMESKGGREIANFALDRATQIYLKRISVIHLVSARFKEYIGDAPKARAALLHCDTDSDSDTDFVENVIMKANMERRLGNLVAASNIYTEAIEKAAAEQKSHILPILYIHCSRLKHMTVDNEDAARDILIDGIKHVPYCKVLIEELIKFAMALKGSRHITVVDSVVSKAIAPGPGKSQGLSVEEGEHISRLYIEFVDLCGTINDVRKAWNQHIRLFPHSVRTTCSSVTGTKRWKVSKEEKQENLDTLPPEDSGEEMSDFLILSSMQEKEQGPLPETPDSQAADPATEQMPDQKSPLLENHEMLSDSGAVKPCESGESDSNKKMKLDCASHRDSEEQSTEDDPKPNSSLVSVNEVTDATEGPQAVLEFSKENSVLEQSDYEPEPELKPPSLDGLSLDTLDAKSADPLTAKSHDFEAPQGMASVPPTPSEFEAPQEPSNMQKSEARQENSMSSEFEAPQELSFPNRNMQRSEAHQENSMSSEFEAPQELSFPNRNMQRSEARQVNSMLMSEFEAPQELSFPNRNMQKSEARQENSMSSDFESPQELSFSNQNMQKSEARQENSMSNESLPESSKYATVEESSPASTPATVSALINTENLSPSASASNLNIMAPAVSRPQMSEHRGRNWHQRSNPDRFQRDSKYGFRRNSHRRSHQPQQASPHQQYPRSERGSRLPASQGYPSQPASSQNPQGQQGSGMQSQYYEPVAQGNLAPTQAWSTQGTQQQNPSAPCQPQQPVQPGTFPQPQMSQYPVQGNEQQGSLPNNQVYNQMWQYYYYQQQQQLLWQQQQQQQQQPQDQQLLQQQYQQQMLQMQYLQQQLPPQQQQEQLQLLLQQQQQQFLLQQQRRQLLLQQQQLQLQPQQASQLELIQQQTNLQLQPQQASQLQQQLLQQHTNQQLQTQQQHLLYMQHQQLQLHLQQQQQQQLQQQAMSSQKQHHEQEQGNHTKD